MGILAGCPRTELTGRYLSAEFVGDPVDEHRVVATVGVADVPAAPPPEIRTILLSLAERGQAAYVQGAQEVASPDAGVPGGTTKPARSKPDPDEFLRLLRAPVAEKPRSSGADRPMLTRRILLAVDKKELRPADRVVLLRLKVDKVEGGTLADVTWNNPNPLAVDVGDVTRTQYGKLTADLKGKSPIPLVPVEAGLTYETNTQVSETAKIRDRGVQFAVFGTNQAILGVTAPLGIDLAGMVTIDLTVQLALQDSVEHVLELDSLGTGAGNWADPKAVKVKHRPLSLVDASKDVQLQLSGQYQLRCVERGGGTVQEGDDVAVYHSGELGMSKLTKERSTGTIPVVLATAEKLRDRNTVYEVREKGPKGELLMLDIGGRKMVVRFATEAECLTFLEWWSAKRPLELGLFRLCFEEADYATRIKELQLVARKEPIRQ
jgi:hypothetical protein